MKIRLIMASIGTGLSLAACGAEFAGPDVGAPPENQTAGTYWIDSRTGLCFLQDQASWSSRTNTNVPCTPDVKRLARVR